MAVDIPIRYVKDDKAIKETIAEWKKFQKQVGLTDEEIERANKSTKELNSRTRELSGGFSSIKDAIGKLGIAAALSGAAVQLAAMVQNTNALRREISNLTNTSGRELDVLTAKVMTLANAYGKDFREVLIAANALSKEFEITQTEALSKIEKGFINGADASGEFLDSIREYPTQARAAGLSLDQFIRVLERSTQAGVFSDKGIDTIKEGTLRIREFSDTTAAAFEAIGFNSEEVRRDLESGQKTIFQVIQEVSQRLDELPPQSRAVGQAIADIFGGPGEDAGLKFITTLKDIDSELTNVSEETARYREQQTELLKAQTELNIQLAQFAKNFDALSLASESFLTRQGSKLLRLFNNLVDLFKSSEQQAKEFAEVLQSDDLGFLQSQLQDKIQNSIQGFGTNEEQIRALIARIEELRDVQAENAEATNESANATDRLGNAADNASGKVDRFAESIQRISTGNPEADLQKELADIENQIRNLGLDEITLGDTTAAFEDAENRRTRILREQADQRLEIERDAQRKKEEIYYEGYNTLFELSDAFYQGSMNRIQEEYNMIALLEESKLSLVGNNAQAQKQIRQEMDQQRKELARQEAESNKKRAAFEAFINTAVAITRVLGNPLAVAFVAASGLAQQIAIRSRSVPGFKHGTKNVPGIDTGGDTVAAMLRPGEKVFSRETSKAYEPALDAIFDRKIAPEVANAAFSHANNSKSSVMYTPKDLETAVGRALQKIPFHNISIDKQGFHDYVKSVGSEVSKDINEFKF
ncbi:phage tail tape measure protein [Catalinimonas sp. 4WD22]|uniref:phage tail tape measure protein n=1 Tax=Catalinimonas locisalis TaxID=3133978 RepID=UPI00310122E7